MGGLARRTRGKTEDTEGTEVFWSIVGSLHMQCDRSIDFRPSLKGIAIPLIEVLLRGFMRGPGFAPTTFGWALEAISRLTKTLRVLRARPSPMVLISAAQSLL